jgi:hypothetical protein
VAFTIWALLPCFITGKIWRKSPEKQTVIPAKGVSQFRSSRKVLSPASNDVGGMCDGGRTSERRSIQRCLASEDLAALGRATRELGVGGAINSDRQQNVDGL